MAPAHIEAGIVGGNIDTRHSLGPGVRVVGNGDIVETDDIALNQFGEGDFIV